jgi:hypothetical protein
LRAIVDALLSIDVTEVGLDRLGAQEQQARDALVRPALGDDPRTRQVASAAIVWSSWVGAI